MRLALVLLIALFSATGFIGAKPLPRERYATAQQYFPSRVGTKWVYHGREVGREPVEEIRSVTAAEDREGMRVISVRTLYENKTTTNDFLWGMSEDGLFKLGDASNRLERPVCVLQLPLRPGARWTFHVAGKEPTISVKGTAVAFAPEQVRVPAGTYRAVRVEIRAAAKDGTDFRWGYWFAPDVGIVKWTFDVTGQAPQQYELTSFTPGRE